MDLEVGAPTKIATAVGDLLLRPITATDIPELQALIQKNRRHLTRHGDYEELVASTPQALLAKAKAEIMMGLRLDGDLIGIVSLTRHAPGAVGLGYWLDAGHTGHGYMTAACRAVIGYAEADLGAREVWAGVRAGNGPSIRLLTRLGFYRMRVQPTHLSYRLDLARKELGSPG